MGPRSNHRPRKPGGKESGWSDWTKDEQGRLYSSRYDSAGQPEYKYQDEGQDVEDDEDVPCSPAANISRSDFPTSSYSSAQQQSSLGPTSDGAGAENTYRTSNDAGSTSQQIAINGPFPPSTEDSYKEYYPITSVASTDHSGSGYYAGGDTSSAYGARIGENPYNSNYYEGAHHADNISPYSTTQGESSQLPLSFRNLAITAPNSYGSNTTPQGGDYTSASLGSNFDQYDKGKLNPSYCIIDIKSEFWKVGRVFACLWTEPARSVPKSKDVLSSHGSQYVETYLGGSAYTEIRRFVILQDGHGSCICSPIHSYGGQATLKENLAEPQEHAIIYTTSTPPSEYHQQIHGRDIWEDLGKDPIKVNRDRSSEETHLSPSSRLNYSKVYTVYKDYRILNIGMVENLSSLLASSHVQRNTPIGKSRSSSSRSGAKKGGRKDKDKDTDRRKR